MEIVPSNQKQIKWIDLAKGICILLVVFHHAIVTSYIIPGFDLVGFQAFSFRVYELISLKLVPLRMPLFFMISGFLVYRGVISYPWDKVWFNRIQTIWYVYILWSVIQWCCVAVMMSYSGSIFLEKNTSLANYANDLLSFVSFVATGSSSLWYLYVLPFYFIICKVFSSRPVICILLLSAVNVASQYYNFQFPVSSITKNGVYYAVGCFLCPTILPILNRLYNFKKVLLLISCLVLAKVTLKLIGLELELFNAILIVSITILLLNWFQEHWDIPVLRWIGKNTLSIYVIHQIFLKLLSIILVPALISSGIFANSMWLTIWYASYPIFAVMFMILGSVLIWKITNKGWGKYLYNSPKLT